MLYGLKLRLNGSSFANSIEWAYSKTGSVYAEIYTDSAGQGLFLRGNSGIYANGRRLDTAPVATFG